MAQPFLSGSPQPLETTTPITSSLILVRHAAPQIDVTVPAHTWPLSDKGRDSCYELAERLRPHGPTRIITSTETKARQTGDIIANTLQLPIEDQSGLHEHDRSNVTDLDQATFQILVARLLTDPNTLVFGQETGTQARNRFTQAIFSIRRRYPDDTLIVVTHGTVLTLFIALYNPIDPVSWWQNLRLPDFFCLSEPGFQLIHHNSPVQSL